VHPPRSEVQSGSARVVGTAPFNDRKANTLIQFGEQRDPELPNVPLLAEYARSPTEAEALKLIFSSGEAGRPYAAPQGIPADRLDALRRAFDATMKDPEFWACPETESRCRSQTG
jgi:hypothetical protein